MPRFNPVEVTVLGDVTVVRLLPPQGKDSDVLHRLRDQLVTVTETGQPQKAIVDFGELEQYPLEVLSCVLAAQRRLRPGELVCCGVPQRLRWAARFLRLEGRSLTICGTMTAALAHLSESEPRLPTVLTTHARATPIPDRSSVAGGTGETTVTL